MKKEIIIDSECLMDVLEKLWDKGIPFNVYPLGNKIELPTMRKTIKVVELTPTYKIDDIIEENEEV